MLISEKTAVGILRISMGWLMLYAGLTKVFNPSWSAAGYLNNAKTFPEFFRWFASPEILPITNLINEWGLTLLGVSLILGIGVRLSSTFGVLLMLLYYFPALEFPYAGANSYIIDDHIIYALILVYFAEARAGRVWGLDKWFVNLPIFRKTPRLKKWLG